MHCPSFSTLHILSVANESEGRTSQAKKYIFEVILKQLKFPIKHLKLKKVKNKMFNFCYSAFFWLIYVSFKYKLHCTFANIIDNRKISTDLNSRVPRPKWKNIPQNFFTSSTD
jgi:hypothetical protein